MLDAADEYATRGDNEQALAIYADAFDTMPADLRAGGVGELVALAVGDAALADYRARGQVQSLEIGRRVLLDFIAAVDALEPHQDALSTANAEQKLRALEAAMPEPSSVPGQERNLGSGTGRSAQDGVDRGGESDERDREVHGSEKLGGIGRAGIVLLASGGVGVGTGVGLLIREPRPGPTGTPDASRLQSTRPAGGVILGVGTVVVATGVTLLVLDIGRRKRGGQLERTTAFQPWMVAAGAGLVLTRRF